jgi:uncharacterized protein involved in exopolysaccharide biosynthesis
MAVQMDRPQEIGTPVEVRRVLLGLRRLRWVIAGAAVVGTVAGAAMAKSLVEQVFEARIMLECDRCSRPDYGDRELATLQETIKLPQHLEKARQKLGLTATLENLDLQVDVGASLESRLIRVTAREKSGELAAGLANAIVEAFMETRLQIEHDVLDERARVLAFDADRARKSVNEARERYDQFRRDNNIADLPTERQAAIQEAARLRSELALARGEEEAERARALALERASSREPATTVLGELEEVPDAKHLAEIRAQLTEAEARLSAEHPRVQGLAAEVEMLEQKLAMTNETFTTRRDIGLNPRRESAQQSMVQARASQEAARTLHLTYEKLAQEAARAAARLSNIEGQASELLSNLENAERHSTTIQLELKTAEDAARKPSTGLRILAPARVPTLPVDSPRKAVVVLSPFAGPIFAALLLILYELWGLRIHTATELTYWGNGPTIAGSRWPNLPASFHELVEDLSHWLSSKHGKTILIGASGHESALVEALARAIRDRLDDDQYAVDTLSPLTPAPALRRAMRTATRVLVVVAAGKHFAMALQAFVQKITTSARIGFILVDIDAAHESLADLAGNVEAFWQPAPIDNALLLPRFDREADKPQLPSR